MLNIGYSSIFLVLSHLTSKKILDMGESKKIDPYDGFSVREEKRRKYIKKNNNHSLQYYTFTFGYPTTGGDEGRSWDIGSFIICNQYIDSIW